MKYEHWQIPAAPEDAIKTLMDAGYPYLVSSVLAARGVTTSEQAAEALEREKTLASLPVFDEGHGQGRRAHLEGA